jgi:hypothetical protein
LIISCGGIRCGTEVVRAPLLKARFVADSLLEGEGFEPSVPR